MDRTQKERVATLRAAIARSGLSDRRFATRVLTRNERTLRRWVSGERPIPNEVLGSRWIRDPIPREVLDWLDAD